ncbi:glycosyltransferase 61 family protein [Paracoccus sp. PAR01]|uniref:glycosyltransferase 61 family protein n=1 Tax=Paracoccus sp. PAR01 TaxID=2769282 RepID=UPI00177B0100|nr:glycosyltransferase family 61 protein [Paracoccus sp. PAR01]MBD9526351.1 glycosyltransferase family 61 protein [Paracoccus sp. PAR01]
MALELRRPPMDMFHMPSLHEGMYYIPPRKGWVMRPAAGATVRLFAGSDSDTINDLQELVIERQQLQRFKAIMEINSAPVVLENAEFRNSFAMINGRFWLNGASGDRIRNKVDVQNNADWRKSRIKSAFRRARNNGTLTPALWKGKGNDLDIAIELKNGFNYYHFTTETLGSLAHFVKDKSGRPINLHLPQDNIKGFLSRFISAIYPSIADRVNFVTSGTKYERVRSVYNHRHYLYQVRDPRIDDCVSISDEPKWHELNSDNSYRKEVSKASFDSSLRMLREQALGQLSADIIKGMPKLVFMGRDESGDARARGLVGHEPLLEELGSRGFEVVVFEHLSPLEQIAAMQAADIVIAPHGAGLANMTYSHPDSLVIEIGTRQTQMHRWGDFLANAHVSGCHYDTVFADIAGVDDPDLVPPMAEGHLGVKIGKRATDRILQIVDERMAAISKPSVSRSV